MRTAVVGHVEWVQFLRVDHLPAAGEIVRTSDSWELPGGGAPVAAVQLLKLASDCVFITALGDDELGHRALAELRALGLDVHAVFRDAPQRRAITHVDARGERTITIVGERLHPRGDDPLPWDELGEIDAAYFTAGDGGALGAARSTRRLVATTRVLPLLQASAVSPDAVVGSDRDRDERYETGDLDPPPDLAVLTRGGEGGRFSLDGGPWQEFDPTPVPGPVVDAYGCGDSFAGALAFGLAASGEPSRAVDIAARCGAAVLTGRGPYERQLSAPELFSETDPVGPAGS
jgi:ribokinase